MSKINVSKIGYIRICSIPPVNTRLMGLSGTRVIYIDKKSHTKPKSDNRKE